MKQLHALAIISIAALVSVNVSQIARSAQAQPQATFNCEQMFDPVSNEKIPFTIAWVPERHGNVQLIGWKSQYFQSNLSNAQRCQIVTQKMQRFYDNRQLNYLTYGPVGHYQVICATSTETEQCNSANQLFTIKPFDRPDLVLQSLTGVLNGNADPIPQSSGQAYIPIQNLLNQKPLIEPNHKAGNSGKI